MRLASTVRAVALFEAAKGALVFLAGFSVLSLIHHFELYELFRGATWLSFGALLANIFIVGLMIIALLRAHRAEPVNAV